MTTLSIHDLEPQLAANRRFWCGWAGDQPGTDLTLYRSDIEHVLFNGVLRVRDQPLDVAVEKAKKHLAGTQWSWWVSADSDEGTADGLVAHGGEPTIDMPVMAIDVTTVPDAQKPDGLTIRSVVGKAELHEYVSAYAGPLGFEGDIDVMADRELRFTYPDLVRLAGIVDGKTVGTCTVSLGTGDVGALYCIATDPAYRRRGIATALTRDALRIIRESGRRVATLQASSEGEPVYRNIGFETVARYRLFTFSQ
jgi:ribosomal protein S18 acetylase RimI-like enzyme